MPDNRQVQNNAVSTTADKFHDGIWRLKIQTHGKQEGGSAHSRPYPDRPGEPDCIYYLRTGLCGYGSNCRFNHPIYYGQGAQYRAELPERVGQPDCQYYLKTGTCKYGATCKYHHPRERQDTRQVQLNMFGLPLRQEEKSCPYYMKTGVCKFGVACKFHHPQPSTLGVVSVTGSVAFGSTGSSVMASSSLPFMGGIPAWSPPRASYLSGPRAQGPQVYMPIVLSPSQDFMSGQQAWNTYTGTMSPASSTNALGSNLLYNSRHQAELGLNGQVHLLSTSVRHFPERPDQPECQYFMKTGNCKFGSNCKYHHPKEKIAPVATSTLGPLGLPLRPGQPICSFYSLYGICKFGPNCKFDHPLAGLSYDYGASLPALSIPDPPFFPYRRNSPMTGSSETSPSKSSKFPNKITKSELTNTKDQNTDTEEAPEDSPQQGTPTLPKSPDTEGYQQDQSD